MSAQHLPSPFRARGFIGASVVVWLVLFVLGVWGHLEAGNDWADAAFKTLQLFHLHYHPERWEMDPPIEPGWPLEIARFGSALWGLTFVPLVVGFLFEDRLRRWWVLKFWRKHVIVCGDCSRTLSFIRDLRRRKEKVVFIGRCPISREHLPAGTVYLEGDGADPGLLAVAAPHRASRLVLLNQNDRPNLEAMVAAERLGKVRKSGVPLLECFAHIENMHLQSGLYKAMSFVLPKMTKMRVHSFNYYEIAARLLVWKYPVPATLTEITPVPEHFIIVGFGDFGQNMALKLVKISQQLFLDPTPLERDTWRVQKPRITAVDLRGDDCAAPFLRLHPGFASHCDFLSVALSCEQAEFVELRFLDAKDFPARTSIIFCLENEAVTLQTLLLLLEVCGTSDKRIDYIYIRIAQPERLDGLLEHLQPKAGPKLIFFAPDSEVFNADVLLKRNLDVLARAIHEAWLKVEADDRRNNNLPPAAGKQWDDLSEDDRQSNREAADHTWAKIRTLGYELQPAPARARVLTPDTQLLQELRNREEELARTEHYRWMTWRLLNGWTFGPKRDNQLKHHPDMIPYEQLSKTTKDKDRVIIRAIPELLELGRLRAVKKAVAG